VYLKIFRWQEGNGGTYRKEKEAGKEKRNIQEGNGGTYKKETGKHKKEI
jgi:hypothetical protein